VAFWVAVLRPQEFLYYFFIPPNERRALQFHSSSVRWFSIWSDLLADGLQDPRVSSWYGSTVRDRDSMTVIDMRPLEVRGAAREAVICI
jgi:hypothetical protein